ncbi:amidohydrolase family protein [Paraburkholderia sediminicola]|uniref:amidohydrolase family protein n=1 Tax=Paraburkholderia sediminicola TaxID=458836 RepID=UPI0038BBEF79
MATAELPVFKHVELNPAWLDRLREDIIDPDLPIVDPHHHLWDRSGGYLLDELLADTGSGHNITATVYVQCGYAYRPDGPEAFKPVGETEFVASVAEEAARRGAKTRVCAGIVGYADLTLGDEVDAVLQAHIDAGGGRFRSVRHIVARHASFQASLLTPPPLYLMNDATFRRGVSRLGAFNLCFDAWLYHTQIRELADLARAFPELPIVMNHLGGPLGVGPYQGRRDEVFREWRDAIAELAECPNAYVKLGGLAMAIAGFEFHREPLPPSSGELANAWRPYMDACIEHFGAERCMFETNSPVDKGMCGYPVIWNAYKRIASGASASEKAALFHDTATRVYKLGH